MNRKLAEARDRYQRGVSTAPGRLEGEPERPQKITRARSERAYGAGCTPPTGALKASTIRFVEEPWIWRPPGGENPVNAGDGTPLSFVHTKTRVQVAVAQIWDKELAKLPRRRSGRSARPHPFPYRTFRIWRQEFKGDAPEREKSVVVQERYRLPDEVVADKSWGRNANEAARTRQLMYDKIRHKRPKGLPEDEELFTEAFLARSAPFRRRRPFSLRGTPWRFGGVRRRVPEVWSGGLGQPGCPFCGMPADSVIWKNEFAYAVRHAFPVTPLHTLVIPQRTGLL